MAAVVQSGDRLTDEIEVIAADLESGKIDLDRLIHRARDNQQVRQLPVLANRLVVQALAAEQLRQLEPERGVVGLHLRHALVDGDRRSRVVVLLVIVRQHLVLGAGFVQQSLLVVELRQPLVDHERRRIQLDDLLVDGDGLDEEAIVRVPLGDLGKQPNRLVDAFEAGVEITYPVERVGVVGMFRQDLAVFLDGRLELALGDVLLGGADDFFAVQRHRQLPTDMPRSTERGGLGSTERKVRRWDSLGPNSASAWRWPGEG